MTISHGELTMTDIYERAVREMDAKDIAHWQSDLYLRRNAISEKLISEYKFKANVKQFRDQIDHVIWYDIPFAYTPYWEERGQKNKKEGVQ